VVPLAADHQAAAEVRDRCNPRLQIPGETAIDVRPIVLTEEPASPELAVLSYNIRYANPGDGDDAWPHRAETVFDVIGSHDVVGLQEVTAEQWDAIRAATPTFQWYGVGRDDGERAGEFAPLGFRRARFQQHDAGTFWLSEIPDQIGSRGWDAALPRIASWVQLEDRRSGRRLVVVNTHFDHRGDEARRRSGGLIQQRLPALAEDFPVIVMGDLNAVPDSPPLQALQHGPVPLRDSRSISRSPPVGPLGTWNGFNEIADFRRIDHLLVGPGVTVERYETLDPRTPAGRFASDHLPVAAVVRLPAATE